MANKELDRVEAKAADQGIGSLTKEELKLLKYAPNEQEDMVNSDDYSDVQIDNIKKSQKEGKRLSGVEKAALVGKKVDKQNEQLDVFIHGTNDVFTKNYDFKEDGVSFFIAIREPNIREQGLILGKTNVYLDGMSRYVDPTWFDIFYTLSLIRQCGVDVPVELQNDKTIYTPAYKWLTQIGADFSEWEGRFHS